MPTSSQSTLLATALFALVACGGAKQAQHSSYPEASRVAYQPDDMAMGAPPSYEAEADGERYAHIDENRYQDTQTQSVSTFSIDVDTASYANTRRFLLSKQLPPASAVRIEELVNYFSYNYEGPSGDQPFAIHTELSSAPWATGHQLLKIGVQGRRIDTASLPKRNLVFLIDVSGSMSSPNKLPLLKKGFEMLVETMREEDHVSIVVYAGAAGAVLLPTSGADRSTILGSLDKLQSGGSTNGAQGIELAYALAAENFDPEAINRIILASDGDFNVGMTSTEELVALIEKKRESGVYLSILGFGEGNLNDETMETLADKGNGNYSYIDSAREAKKVLVDEGGSTLVTIAKDVKIQVDFNRDAVESYRLIGYENRTMDNEDFDNDQADAGELGPGHTVTALYEIEPKTGSTASQLLELRLRYKLPGQSGSLLTAQKVANRSVAFASASPEMRFAASVAGFGLLLKDSGYKGSLNWAQLQEMAVKAVAKSQDPLRQEFLELIGIARALDGQSAQLAR